jgi:hypothetical protein
MQSRLSLMVALLAIIVTALDHFHGHDAYLIKLNTHQSFLPVTTPPGTPPTVTPLTRKVTIIFVDGLGYQASLELPTLQSHRDAAVWRRLRVQFPSYTYPGIVAYATGVPPRYSGLRLNSTEHLSHLTQHARLPTLLQEAARAKLAVRIDNGDWPEFSDLLDFSKQAARVSLEQLLRPTQSPGLDWIYFGEVDAAGHKHGGDSEEYRAAAQDADALIAKVLAVADLKKDTVVVISDHGHLRQGGHGGHEPEVLSAMLFAIGAGIKPIADAPERSYLDVTPTVAALLGTLIPASSMGRTMLDALDVSPNKACELLASNLQQRLGLEEALTPGANTAASAQLLSRLQQGDTTTLAPAELLLDSLTTRRDAAFETIRDQLSLSRMPWAIVITLLLFIFLGYRRHWIKLAPRDLLPTLIYTVIYGVLYWVAGYSLSWSLPRGEIGFVAETLLFGAFSVGVALWYSRHNQWLRLREETLAMTLFFGLPYLYVAFWIGLNPVYLGGPALSFWLIFLVTIGFYAHGPFGVWLLLRSLRRT